MYQPSKNDKMLLSTYYFGKKYLHAVGYLHASQMLSEAPNDLILIDDFPKLNTFGFISSVAGMVLYCNGIHHDFSPQKL
jgi:hypothetical protein